MTDVPWADEFYAAGYKFFRDQLLDREEKEWIPLPDRMYQGGWQRRVEDDKGTRYWINIALYDFTKRGGGKSVEAYVAFNIVRYHSQTVEVRRTVKETIDEMEAFYEDLWHRMRWDYYERNPW